MQKQSPKLKPISVGDAIDILKHFRYGDQVLDRTIFNDLIKNLAPEKVFNLENFQGMLPSNCPDWKTLTSITFNCTHQCRISCVDVSITLQDQKGNLTDKDGEEIEYDEFPMQGSIQDKLASVMDNADEYDDGLILEMFTDELLAELEKHNVKLLFEGCDTGTDS